MLNLIGKCYLDMYIFSIYFEISELNFICYHINNLNRYQNNDNQHCLNIDNGKNLNSFV